MGRQKRQTQKVPTAGLEPAIPALGGRCVIHYATRAGTVCEKMSLGDDKQKSRTIPKNEARAIRTPNRLIWSQTRYRCAIAPLVPALTVECHRDRESNDGEIRDMSPHCRRETANGDNEIRDTLPQDSSGRTKSDTDGIRTHACIAHRLSRPTP